MARGNTAPSTRREAPESDDDLNNRLFFRLFRASNIYERQAQRTLNMSAVQGAVLGALSREPEDGIAFSELVDYLAVSRQNLDGVLKRLEKLGYVERVEKPENRRIKMVRLTRAGAKAWDDLLRRSLEFFRLGTLGVPRAAKVELADTLSRIGRALSAIDGGPER
jgi:DNA-binding MarR family transcriptional regulator